MNPAASTDQTRYLLYHTYCSGRAGLSNGIMSIELAVVLAFLTERLLVLEGNVTPSANIVDYGDELPAAEPSRITDLFDIPVAWAPAEDLDLSSLDSVELTQEPLGRSVFVYPPELDSTTFDCRSFAHQRTNFVTHDGPRRDASVLRLSGGPPVGPSRFRMHNFCFYSYFFYLNEETRRGVYAMLRRLAPKAPFADLARRVARDLGDFNAVHVRRGDFKQTFGVTTRLRKPREVVEALDPHFARERRLLILTDERNDPFFEEVLACYADPIFIDRFILDHHREAFMALPRRDSIALAFLSQLVASEACDFVGSFTSTFTSMIQRYRGNQGKPECFKFLWNELPDAGAKIERGRHPISKCVAMERGIMLEEYLGPYSWNRYNPRINPAWMREWPESFLSDIS